MSKILPRFFVVDDDPINNKICKLIICDSIPDAEVTSFTDPETGLAFLRSEFSKSSVGTAILFLDINMPTMTGWEFLELYEQEDTIIKDRLSIYILSSSVNPKDWEKAKCNPHILDFIEKPLSEEVLLKIINKFYQLTER